VKNYCREEKEDNSKTKERNEKPLSQRTSSFPVLILLRVARTLLHKQTQNSSLQHTLRDAEAPNTSKENNEETLVLLPHTAKRSGHTTQASRRQ